MKPNDEDEDGVEAVPEISPEMKLKASQIRSTYGNGVRGALEAGRELEAYRAVLADKRQFQAFWRDALAWPRARVYRLIESYRDFHHMSDAVLGQFDITALYTLSGDRDDKVLAREKAISEATGGRYITSAVATKLMGKTAQRSAGFGTIRLTLERLTEEAKKLKLNAKTVIKLLENLGIHFDWQETAPPETTTTTPSTRKGTT